MFEGFISRIKKTLPEDWLLKDSVQPNHILRTMVNMIYRCEKTKSIFKEYFNLNRNKGIFKEQLERNKSGKRQNQSWSLELLEESIDRLYKDRKSCLENSKNDFKEKFKKKYYRFVKEISKRGNKRSIRQSDDLAVAK